jgi:hypothetical protein
VWGIACQGSNNQERSLDGRECSINEVGWGGERGEGRSPRMQCIVEIPWGAKRRKEGRRRWGSGVEKPASLSNLWHKLRWVITPS